MGVLVLGVIIWIGIMLHHRQREVAEIDREDRSAAHRWFNEKMGEAVDLSSEVNEGLSRAEFEERALKILEDLHDLPPVAQLGLDIDTIMKRRREILAVMKDADTRC